MYKLKQKKMKKYLVALLVIFISTGVIAQEHLTFKGIEINGDIKEFVTKLKNNGYSQDEMNNDGTIYTLTGKFAGFDKCTIYVVGTKTSKTVWKVMVMLPDQRDWYSLKDRFTDMHSSLVDKYGKPSDEYHFFSDPYYEGDGYELQALYNEKCSYFSSWTFETGYVYMRIRSFQYGSGFIAIMYEDLINGDLSSKEKHQETVKDL